MSETSMAKCIQLETEICRKDHQIIGLRDCIALCLPFVDSDTGDVVLGLLRDVENLGNGKLQNKSPVIQINP